MVPEPPVENYGNVEKEGSEIANRADRSVASCREAVRLKALTMSRKKKRSIILKKKEGQAATCG